MLPIESHMPIKDPPNVDQSIHVSASEGAVGSPLQIPEDLNSPTREFSVPLTYNFPATTPSPINTNPIDRINSAALQEPNLLPTPTNHARLSPPENGRLNLTYCLIGGMLLGLMIGALITIITSYQLFLTLPVGGFLGMFCGLFSILGVRYISARSSQQITS